MRADCKKIAKKKRTELRELHVFNSLGIHLV